MRVIAIICTAVLVMEFVLHGIAMLIGMEAAIQPLTDHFGFRPNRLLGVAIGALDLIAAAALIVGFWRRDIGLAAAGYAVAFFGLLMALRFYRNLGTLVWPPDFPLFLTLAVTLFAIHLSR